MSFDYDSEELGARFLEIEKRLDTLEKALFPNPAADEEREKYNAEHMARYAEELRVQRWHATYNAALSRAAAFTHGAASTASERQHVHDVVHEACVMYADRVHGPLQP